MQKATLPLTKQSGFLQENRHCGLFTASQPHIQNRPARQPQVMDTAP